ncbi:MAG: hypothetical protein M1829_005621 [Trizodia sp. TS-e1964]|nr:MAG: hypothetical protein M1829_005621 [Trizodia sp. TS-e1964]
MPPPPNLLANPLASIAQLSHPATALPHDLSASIRFSGARLAQAAGLLLRLPQETIARAIVLSTRFWLGASMLQHGAKDVSAATLYLAAKLSAQPQSPRSVLNVYAYLVSAKSPYYHYFHPAPADTAETAELGTPQPEAYYISPEAYIAQRAALLKTETAVLRVLGFQTHVALPYALGITYLQALDVFAPEAAGEAGAGGAAVAQRVFAHLSAALLSPQQVYISHQPCALATAAIYLAAREVGVKLPGGEWWAVFDVEREELGFLVVAMRSMKGWVEGEEERWKDSRVPLTVGEVEGELDRRGLVVGG